MQKISVKSYSIAAVLLVLIIVAIVASATSGMSKADGHSRKKMFSEVEMA